MTGTGLPERWPGVAMLKNAASCALPDVVFASFDGSEYTACCLREADASGEKGNLAG